MPIVKPGEEKAMKVEDQYTDVFQNIELGIVLTYKSNPEMSDSDVMGALEALIDRYADRASHFGNLFPHRSRGKGG